MATHDAAAVIAELGTFSSADLRDNAVARKKALAMSQQLSILLQTPLDATVFSPYVAIAARIAVDLDLFEHICAHKGISTAELAAKAKSEPLMISISFPSDRAPANGRARLLRLLAGLGFVRELAQDQWAATSITEAMATPLIAAGHQIIWDVLITNVAMAPKYLCETSHRCPTEPSDGFVQYAKQTKLPIFDYVATKTDLVRDFDTYMGNNMGVKRYWVD